MSKNSYNNTLKWYSISIRNVLSKLNTSLDGLSSKEVNYRIKEYGYNSLPTKKPPSFFKIFLTQFLHPIIFILIIASLASLLINEIVDAVFIMIVIIFNSLLGAFQEWKAEKSAVSLQTLLKVKVRVRRNFKEVEIDADNLVPGDIVLIESGNKIPADIRLVTTHNLTADESLLTGESQPYEKNTDLLDEDTNIHDRSNMCYAGSSVLSGRGVGIVVATSLQTEVGKIAEKVIYVESSKPPLVIRMEKFSKQITIFVIIIALLISVILFYRGFLPREVFFFVVALAVSTIPEGLPVALTVALSVATSRMFKRNVIVRKLTAVESLGSCTVIASDKTGTLTVNQQTVRLIRFPDDTKFSITGEGYNDIGNIVLENKSKSEINSYKQLQELAKVVVLTNEGNLEKVKNKWVYYGDYMDIALLSFGYKIKLNPLKVRSEHEIIGMIPYESENKFSASFYKKDNKSSIGVKGAVETILDFCTHMQTINGVTLLDKHKIEKQANDLAELGYRVLGVAYSQTKNITKKANYDIKDIKNLVFLGLVAFIDPLRKEAKEAVLKCHSAGIRVLMITGDHPKTATSLARELGILDNSKTVTGNELQEIFEKRTDDFDKLVKNTKVFARISPLQKLQIVESLRKQGEFVAVTGDGVNDAPALRSANIGVAMGTGTDVARETSSMIITDDNFLSIVSGVEEGRYAYDNVRKVILLLISTGFAEVFLFILAVILNLPLPLLAVQILWLNLVTNGIQDIALAFEGGEDGAMKRKPRPPNERIFNKKMIEQTIIAGLVMGSIAFGLWFYLINIQLINPFQARNYILLLMVFMQNIHTFNCRSEFISVFKIPLRKNIILTFGVLLALLLHLIIMQLPFMQEILHVNPISINEIILMFGLAIPLLIIMELYKYRNNK